MFSFDFSVRPGEIVPLHKSPVVLQPRLFPLHANLLFSLTFAFINENAESQKKKNGLENQHLWERKQRALLFCGSRGTSAWDAPLDPAPPLLQQLPGQHPCQGLGERSSACAEGRIMPCTLSQAHICLAPNLLSPGKTHGPTSCRPSARVHLRQTATDWVKQPSPGLTAH